MISLRASCRKQNAPAYSLRTLFNSLQMSPRQTCACRNNFSTSSSNTDSPPSDSRNGRSNEVISNSLSSLLTKEQRTLLRHVYQLSSMARTLARQIGNVPVKEDSLISDISRVQNELRRQVNQPSLRSDTLGNTSQYPEGFDQEDISMRSTFEPDFDETINDTDYSPPSLFTVVFAGEFNAGKSTLINALLGKEFLESGVLPTTDAITVLMGSDKTETDEIRGVASLVTRNSVNLDNNAINTVPTSAIAHTELHLLSTSRYPILSDLCLIDTPGTNAILSLQHTSSTLRILHDADLIVFVTSADRPFSESEKQLLKTSIKSYRKRVVLVINKMDVLERQKGEDHGEKTKKKVVDFVTEHAGELLGARPVVIPVSARDALSVKLLYACDNLNVRSKDLEQISLWKRSNLASLEHFLLETLTATSRIKTKLLNPLGVTEGILLDCQHEITKRQEGLEADIMILRLLNSQTAAWENEILSEVLDHCRSKVKEVFIKKSLILSKVLEQLSIIDQFQMGLGMGWDAFNGVWEDACQQNKLMALKHKPSLIKINYESDTLLNELRFLLSECSDTLSSRSKAQGQATLEYLGKRPTVVSWGSNQRNSTQTIDGISRMVGVVKVAQFTRLQEDLNTSFMYHIENVTKDIPNDLWKGQIYSLLCRVSLISNAFYVSAIVSCGLTHFDVVDSAIGVVSSSAMLTLGIIASPLGHRFANKKFQTDLMTHADQIDTSLKLLFSDNMRHIKMQLVDSFAPYSRFVVTENDLLSGLKIKLESCMSSAYTLRSRINKATD